VTKLDRKTVDFSDVKKTVEELVKQAEQSNRPKWVVKCEVWLAVPGISISDAAGRTAKILGYKLKEYLMDDFAFGVEVQTFLNQELNKKET